MLEDKDIKTFFEVLETYRKRSTCFRVQVSAIVVKDGRILTTGWNGVLSGQMHCDEYFNIRNHSKMDFQYALDNHKEFSHLHEIHAEQNAIGHAAKHGLSVNGADLYTWTSPCLMCAKLIAASGIKRVFFVEEYDREIEGIDFLTGSNIIVGKITKNGECTYV